MPILRERNDLDKKWTWYLFLAANVCVLIGCAATWMMVARGEFNLLFLPTIICNLVAIALAAVFMWFESKDTMPKAVHFQKKWLWWYLAALIIFCSSILFNCLYYVFMLNGPGQAKTAHNENWVLIIYFVITGVLTLIAIGFQRYARYRIDLDIYRRKHGQMPKDKEKAKAEKKAAKKKDKYSDSDPKASAGLLDEIK